MIPKPFTKVFLLSGDPIDVPAGLAREDLDHYADLVQAEMDLLSAHADQLGTRQQAMV